MVVGHLLTVMDRLHLPVDVSISGHFTCIWFGLEGVRLCCTTLLIQGFIAAFTLSFKYKLTIHFSFRPL